MAATDDGVQPFDIFRDQLREALARLHDPDYQPAGALGRALGPAAELQAALLQAIEGLAPAAGVPPTSRARRDYEILHQRFCLGLTQEEAAERLHMSVRTLGRAQRQATHALARRLWEQQPAERRQPWPDEPPSDWRTQIRENLAALRANAPELVSNVREAIAAAVERSAMLASPEGTTLRLGALPADLLARMHPSALRQVLIMAAAQLLHGSSRGAIEINAELADDRVLIHLQGLASTPPALPDADLLREILAFDGGSLDLLFAAGRMDLRIAVPAAGPVIVLVVDDNLDAVHYYRRCTEGTRFRIVHAQQGRLALEAIAAQKPGVVLLDIVLPDMDGWELLERLRRDPATGSVPVIVCSIVREERLASALGAVRYLPKPVRDWELLQALEQALS